MSRRVVLVVLNDTHGGHALGLMPPDITLYDLDEAGNEVPWQPTPTPTQRYLWAVYLRCIRQVYELAGGDEIVVLHNGDECQGNKHPSRLVSARMADQIRIAAANLGMWLQVPTVQHLRLAIGTGAHDYLDGSSTLLVQQQLQAQYPGKSVRLCYHGHLDCNGVMVDYAHHGPYPGSRNWLRGNVARLYLRDLMQREIERGQRPPDVVFRAHYHSPVYEYLEQRQHVSRLYVVPSFCGLDDHAYQATRSVDEVTFGMVALEIVDGRIAGEHRMYETLDIRTKERL